MFKIKRYILLSMVTALTLVTGCSEPEKPTAPPVRPVKLITVQENNRENIRHFPAKVYASKVAEISFRISGELVDLPVKQGESVKKGQLLAKLDDRDIISDLNLKKADFNLAKSEFHRVSELLKKKVISQSEYDSANARLKSTQAALQLSRDKLKDSVLHAPFNGRVAQTLVENYQFIQAQQTILVLQGSTILDISIQVPENVLRTIQEENVDKGYQPIVTFPGVSLKSYKVSYKEHATLVTAGTQSYQVIFTMPTPKDLTVYPGMGATLSMDMAQVVKSSQPENSFLIPLTAVLQDDTTGKEQVWVYDNKTGKVNPVAVTLGKITQSGVTVLSGIKSGQHLVSAGLSQLHPGMVVRPLTRERGL